MNGHRSWLMLFTVAGLFALCGANCPSCLAAAAAGFAAGAAAESDLGASHRGGQPQQRADSIVLDDPGHALLAGRSVAAGESSLFSGR